MKTIIILIILSLFLFGCAKQEINSFEDCVNAGNPVMESYPRKCRADNRTFVEEIEELPKVNESTIVGPPGEVIIEPITVEELSKHNTEQDCWVVYEGKVFDFTDTKMHPNMAKVFFSHCGKLSFEEAAKARHSKSSESRVDNYGEYVGVLE
jgi:cytochrome b involved in lipid metabolism